MSLDPRRYLDNDPGTVRIFGHIARQWARRHFDNPDQLESIVQTTQLEMTLRLRAGERPAPKRLAYWIGSCTRNVMRREWTRTRHATIVAFESDLHAEADVDMSLALRLQSEIEEIEQTLDHADDRTRRILEGRVRGFTYREIATMNQMTEAAARKSMDRLRTWLMSERRGRHKAGGHEPLTSRESPRS
jgi:DNA-directed RNA polymerase specialized sigma24 family protein